MKNIDKAGVEWHLSHPEADKEETWKAGANYVLEEIENLVKTTIGEGETYHYNLHIGLVNLLEQLKK